MIKSELGRTEVKGTIPVIMTDLVILLGTLKGILGDECYNLALQKADKRDHLGKDADTLSDEEKERIAKAIKRIFGMEDK